MKRLLLLTVLLGTLILNAQTSVNSLPKTKKVQKLQKAVDYNIGGNLDSIGQIFLDSAGGILVKYKDGPWGLIDQGDSLKALNMVFNRHMEDLANLQGLRLRIGMVSIIARTLFELINDSKHTLTKAEIEKKWRIIDIALDQYKKLTKLYP